MGEARSTELAALVERPLFDVDGETFTWGDAILAAVGRGTWDEVERAARDGLACVRALAAGGEELDPDATRAEARRFRYARDLLSADQLAAWRERWGLSAGAWRDYLVRRAARKRLGAELEAARARFPVPQAEVDEAVGPEAICSGWLEEAAHALAQEAALADRATARPLHSSTEATTRVAALLGLDPGASAARIASLAGLAAAAALSPARTAAREAVEREVQAHALDWTAVDAEFLELADADVAREAAMCVRSDGQPLAEVAALCGATVTPLHVRLGDVDVAALTAVASAREGELVGPLPWNGGFGLVLVHSKRPPDPNDEETHALAAAAVVGRATERAVRERVHWHERA